MITRPDLGEISDEGAEKKAKAKEGSKVEYQPYIHIAIHNVCPCVGLFVTTLHTHCYSQCMSMCWVVCNNPTYTLLLTMYVHVLGCL